MPLSIHPSGYVVQYSSKAELNLLNSNGGSHGFKAKRSRRARFYDVVACLDHQRKVKSFWTFTVPQQQTNFKETDGQISAKFSQLLEMLRLRHKRGKPNGLADYIWVAEAQKRGNIHFHMLTSTKFIDVSDVQYHWDKLLNSKPTYSVDVQYIKSQKIRNVASYFAKYMQKLGHELIDGLKDRVIYTKSFNYSRNFEVIKHKSIYNRDLDYSKVIAKHSRTFRNAENTEFTLDILYLKSADAIELLSEIG